MNQRHGDRRKTDRLGYWLGVLLIAAAWVAVWVVWSVATPCKWNALMCGVPWIGG